MSSVDFCHCNAMRQFVESGAVGSGQPEIVLLTVNDGETTGAKPEDVDANGPIADWPTGG